MNLGRVRVLMEIYSDHSLETSAKEVLFSSALVDLFVSKITRKLLYHILSIST